MKTSLQFDRSRTSVNLGVANRSPSKRLDMLGSDFGISPSTSINSGGHVAKEHDYGRRVVRMSAFQLRSYWDGKPSSIWLAESGAISTLFVPETCYVPDKFKWPPGAWTQ